MTNQDTLQTIKEFINEFLDQLKNFANNEAEEINLVYRGMEQWKEHFFSLLEEFVAEIEWLEARKDFDFLFHKINIFFDNSQQSFEQLTRISKMIDDLPDKQLTAVKVNGEYLQNIFQQLIKLKKLRKNPNQAPEQLKKIESYLFAQLKEHYYNNPEPTNPKKTFLKINAAIQNKAGYLTSLHLNDNDDNKSSRLYEGITKIQSSLKDCIGTLKGKNSTSGSVNLDDEVKEKIRAKLLLNYQLAPDFLDVSDKKASIDKIRLVALLQRKILEAILATKCSPTGKALVKLLSTHLTQSNDKIYQLKFELIIDHQEKELDLLPFFTKKMEQAFQVQLGKYVYRENNEVAKETRRKITQELAELGITLKSPEKLEALIPPIWSFFRHRLLTNFPHPKATFPEGDRFFSQIAKASNNEHEDIPEEEKRAFYYFPLIAQGTGLKEKVVIKQADAIVWVVGAQEEDNDYHSLFAEKELLLELPETKDKELENDDNKVVSSPVKSHDETNKPNIFSLENTKTNLKNDTIVEEIYKEYHFLLEIIEESDNDESIIEYLKLATKRLLGQSNDIINQVSGWENERDNATILEIINDIYYKKKCFENYEKKFLNLLSEEEKNKLKNLKEIEQQLRRNLYNSFYLLYSSQPETKYASIFGWLKFLELATNEEGSTNKVCSVSYRLYFDELIEIQNNIHTIIDQEKEKWERLAKDNPQIKEAWDWFREKEQDLETHQEIWERQKNVYRKNFTNLRFFAQAWEIATDFYRSELLGVDTNADIIEAINKIKDKVAKEQWTIIKRAGKFLIKEKVEVRERQEIEKHFLQDREFKKSLQETEEIQKSEVAEKLLLADSEMSSDGKINVFFKLLAKQVIADKCAWLGNTEYDQEAALKKIMDETDQKKKLQLLQTALQSITSPDHYDKSAEKDSNDNDLTPIKFYHKNQPYYEFSNFYYNEERQNEESNEDKIEFENLKSELIKELEAIKETNSRGKLQPWESFLETVKKHTFDEGEEEDYQKGQLLAWPDSQYQDNYQKNVYLERAINKLIENFTLDNINELEDLCNFCEHDYVEKWRWCYRKSGGRDGWFPIISLVSKERIERLRELWESTNQEAQYPIFSPIPKVIDELGEPVMGQGWLFPEEEQKFPTAEHLFQALKFASDRNALDLINQVLKSSNPADARNFANELTNKPHIRKDWHNGTVPYKLRAMRYAIWSKFSQKPNLKKRLLATGHRLIIENTQLENRWNDDYWGNGNGIRHTDGRLAKPAGQGENWLGRILMEIRSLFRIGEFLNNSEEELIDKISSKHENLEKYIIDKIDEITENYWEDGKAETIAKEIAELEKYFIGTIEKEDQELGEFTSTEPNPNTLKYQFTKADRDKLTYAEFIDLLSNKNENFLRLFRQELSQVGTMGGYFWECVPVTKNDTNREFEFVVVKKEAFNNITQNYSSFQEHINKHTNKYACSFPSRTGATLIIPLPQKKAGSELDYKNLKEFTNNTSDEQWNMLWQEVGKKMTEELEDAAPKWLSTSGLGVPYLHVRIDKEAKYYSWGEYKNHKKPKKTEEESLNESGKKKKAEQIFTEKEKDGLVKEPEKEHQIGANKKAIWITVVIVLGISGLGVLVYRILKGKARRNTQQSKPN